MNTLEELHQTHWQQFMSNDLFIALYESWWHDDRINYWRHTRLLEPALTILTEFGDRSWLTLGDGAGTDAWRLRTRGFSDITATDLDATMLNRSKEAGYINKYEVANAEKLRFEDNTFDFVLLKEVLHHMSRPFLGIYEAMRVARYAVCIIEPLDRHIETELASPDFQPFYESVGNFVYGFTAHEFRKLAYGMNTLGFCYKAMVDIYIPGCEFRKLEPNEPLWNEMKEQLSKAEEGVRNKTLSPNYIQVILFKDAFAINNFNHLKSTYNKWKFEQTNMNPHVGKPTILQK